MASWWLLRWEAILEMSLWLSYFSLLIMLKKSTTIVTVVWRPGGPDHHRENIDKRRQAMWLIVTLGRGMMALLELVEWRWRKRLRELQDGRGTWDT